MEGGNEGGSNAILFQLRTEREKERERYTQIKPIKTQTTEKKNK